MLQGDLIETLNKFCLPLRKWSSNETQLVTRLPKDLQEAGKAYEINDKTHQIKTLCVSSFMCDFLLRVRNQSWWDIDPTFY